MATKWGAALVVVRSYYDQSHWPAGSCWTKWIWMFSLLFSLKLVMSVLGLQLFSLVSNILNVWELHLFKTSSVCQVQWNLTKNECFCEEWGWWEARQSHGSSFFRWNKQANWSTHTQRRHTCADTDTQTHILLLSFYLLPFSFLPHLPSRVSPNSCDQLGIIFGLAA